MQKLNILALLVSFLGAASNLFAQNSLDKDIEPIVAALVGTMNTKASIKNVAVADFTKLDGTSTELGKYLAEQFADALTNSNTNFGVVDRSRVNFLLKEAGLETKGLMDPNTVAKLGKLKGFNAIVTGTITPMSDVIALNVKVLDLETAVTLASRKGNINRTPAVIELEGKELGGGGDQPSKTPTPTKSTEPKLKPPVPGDCVFRKDQYLFECLGCSQSGTTLECKVKITSQGKDAPGVNVNGNYHLIFAIDDEGNRYNLTSNRIGNTDRGTTLVADVPVTAWFSFEKVERLVRQVTRLDIIMDGPGLNTTVTLKGIPVTRK